MRYWWVSQNQTFEHEVGGGYLWSPKTNRDGGANHFYETMREVSYGDIVFSFCNQKIMAIGIAEGPAYTCPKPLEFGKAGAVWDDIGWRVDVSFKKLNRHVQPKDHMNILRQFLPPRYSPIRADGTGNQMYLAEIPHGFAEALIALMGPEGEAAHQNAAEYSISRNESGLTIETKPDILKKWEEVQMEKVELDNNIKQTEREQVIKSRRGQGLFKSRVLVLEKMCRVTRVDRQDHLIASHIKPWAVSNNAERLDGENGLLLTPTIDHLFDNGFISFKDSGDLIISPIAHRPSLNKMGIPIGRDLNVGTFSTKQSRFLEYHRDSILLKARI